MAQNKRLLGILLGIGVLLLVPLIAMQFTADVDWSLADFITAGTLMLVTGLACELVLRKVKTAPYRILICLIILGAFLLAWLELAVGVFGTRFGGN